LPVWIYAMPTMGCQPAHYRILYLELRQRPMSREHARPVRRAGRGASPGAGRGHRGHRTQRPRGQVGPPGPHTPYPIQPSSLLDPGGERWPISPPLAPLIAQLVQQGLITYYWATSTRASECPTSALTRNTTRAGIAPPLPPICSSICTQSVCLYLPVYVCLRALAHLYV
jgi:hypothetical protein